MPAVWRAMLAVTPRIVSKVERAEAVCSDEAMDDIILASDVVMVARGDWASKSAILSWSASRKS
jgi:pyruvate kinase